MDRASRRAGRAPSVHPQPVVESVGPSDGAPLAQSALPPPAFNDRIVDSFFPLLALILLGWFFRRRELLGAAAARELTAFVVWLALPALLFEAIAGASWRQLWQPQFVIAYAGADTSAHGPAAADSSSGIRLPTGTGPSMLAEFYGRDVARASRIMFVTTVLSLATVPACIALLR